MTILLVLLTVLISTIGFAQTGAQVNMWIGHGPQGGSVEPPAFDPQNPSTMYTSSPLAVFQTSDAAGHWSQLAARWVRVLAVDPTNSSTLYGVGPGPNLMLLNSSDGGLTWNALGGLPTIQSSITLVILVIDPSNPAILYAGCSSYDASGGGVFKSTDAGKTWSAVSSGLPILQALNGSRSPGVIALLIDPTNPRTLYAASANFGSAGGGVYKSTDGAASWHAAGPPSFLDVLAMDPQNPNTLYGESEDYLVSRSTDGGATWAVISRSGPRGRHLVVDPQDSSTLYAIDDYSGVMKSADGGGSWSVVLSVPLTSWVAVAPAPVGASAVFAGGTGLGVFKSSDGGLTWATANTGLIATEIISVAIDPQNPQKLYSGDFGAGLFESADGGGNWSAAPGLTPGRVAAIINPQNPAIVYAEVITAGPEGGAGIYKSIDGGQSWVELSLPGDFDFGLPPAIDVQSPNTIYAGGFKTTDGGATWAQLTGFAGSLSTVATDPQNSGTLYAGSLSDSFEAASVSSGVLKSVDGGNTWTGGNTMWQGVLVFKVMTDPSNSRIVYAETAFLDCGSYVCTNDYHSTAQQNVGVYRSTDSGATWAKLQLVSGGAPVAYLVGIDQNGTVYATATGSQSGLFRSQDGGDTWNALPTNGLPGGGGANVLAIDPQNPNHLFAGTAGAGVFEITLAQEE